MLVISLSQFLFLPEFSPSYISMVVVPMGRCLLFVVVLVPPIVLLRVGDIPVVYPFRCLLLIVVCNGWCVFTLICMYIFALLCFALYYKGNI